MTTQRIGFRSTNPHAWMAQMINYAVTGKIFSQLAEDRRSEAQGLDLATVLAFPIRPDSDYVPEPAANHGPLPEAA